MKSIDRPRQVLAIGLSALAGFVDAVGYLSADGYFVSFMSGNTTRLAVNIARAPWLAAIPALLILGFVAGVTAGALIAARAGMRRKSAVLALVASLLGAAAVARESGFGAAMLALLVLAMGAINNTFQRDGEVTVGLTYMTGSLVRLGQGLAASLLGQPSTGWIAYLLLWGGLLFGAICGALVFGAAPGLAAWAAVVWAALMAMAARRIEIPPAA